MVDLSRYKFRVTREGLWCMVPMLACAAFVLLISGLAPWLNARFGTHFGSIREYSEIWVGVAAFVFLAVFACWRAEWRDGPPDRTDGDGDDAAELRQPLASDGRRKAIRRTANRRPDRRAFAEQDGRGEHRKGSGSSAASTLLPLSAQPGVRLSPVLRRAPRAAARLPRVRPRSGAVPPGR